MRTLFNLIAGGLVVLAGGTAVYQTSIVNRQAGELTELRDRVRSAEDADRRATRDLAALRGQLATTVQALTTTAETRAGLSAGIPVPAAQGTVVALTTPDAAGTPAIEFRAPPLDPTVLSALPTAENFDQAYFQPGGSVASWPEMARAGLGLAEKSRNVTEYLSSHAVIAGLIGSLQETSSLLEKDTGTNAEITQSLQKNYAVTVAKTIALAQQIAARPNERADAIEVSKQIESLATAMQRRLPLEYQLSPPTSP